MIQAAQPRKLSSVSYYALMQSPPSLLKRASARRSQKMRLVTMAGALESLWQAGRMIPGQSARRVSVFTTTSQDTRQVMMVSRL